MNGGRRFIGATEFWPNDLTQNAPNPESQLLCELCVLLFKNQPSRRRRWQNEPRPHVGTQPPNLEPIKSPKPPLNR